MSHGAQNFDGLRGSVRAFWGCSCGTESVECIPRCWHVKQLYSFLYIENRLDRHIPKCGELVPLPGSVNSLRTNTLNSSIISPRLYTFYTSWSKYRNTECLSSTSESLLSLPFFRLQTKILMEWLHWSTIHLCNYATCIKHLEQQH